MCDCLIQIFIRTVFSGCCCCCCCFLKQRRLWKQSQAGRRWEGHVTFVANDRFMLWSDPRVMSSWKIHTVMCRLPTQDDLYFLQKNRMKSSTHSRCSLPSGEGLWFKKVSVSCPVQMNFTLLLCLCASFHSNLKTAPEQMCLISICPCTDLWGCHLQASVRAI